MVWTALLLLFVAMILDGVLAIRLMLVYSNNLFRDRPVLRCVKRDRKAYNGRISQT